MTISSLCGLPLSLFLLFQADAFAQNDFPQTGAEPFGANVNTDSDEHIAFRYADKIYFSTELKRTSSTEKVSRTFSALRDLPAVRMPENPRDPSRHMAHLSFNLQANRMYYTLFKKGREGEMKNAEIWYRDRNYDGSWGRQTRPPKPLNTYGYLSSQPAFGYDRISGKELLFFVSDRPGGKGGMDIWASVIKPGKGDQEDEFGEPINLPFNTEGDELSPYFDTRSQTLFFSSDGLQGPGGFDIFCIKKTAKGQWGIATCLKQEVNSIFDEQSFSYHQPSGMAYFSSNRPSEKCDTTLCRNFDVYQLALQPIVRLRLVNAQDNTLLSGGELLVEEMSPGKPFGFQQDSPDGVVSIQVAPETPYRIKVAKEGFAPVFFELMIGSEALFSSLEKTVFLKPIAEQAVQEVKKEN